MLVNINDPEKSNKMIIGFKKNPNCFEWVLFTKVPKTEVDDTTNTQRETLSQLLQKIVQYQLVKLKKVGNFLEYLLKSDTKGIYICMLHTKKVQNHILLALIVTIKPYLTVWKNSHWF